MNGTGNSERKRANSVPRYELIDKDGGTAAVCHSATACMAIARTLWPDQEQDEDRAGTGWDLQVAGS